VSKIDDLLEKTARSIEAAELLLEKGHIDFAASRTYYAYFYIAEALLFSLGLEYSSHGQVLAQYGRRFSKTRLLDPIFHSLFATAFDIRNFADYQIEVPIQIQAVEDLVAGARSFLKAASDYLANLSEPPSGGDADS
jgi:uncharacterized protein (UPF0332 family)